MSEEPMEPTTPQEEVPVATAGEPTEPTEAAEPTEPTEPTAAAEPEPAPAEEPKAEPEPEPEPEPAKSEKSEKSEKSSKSDKHEKAEKEKEEKCAINREVLESAPAVDAGKVADFFKCASPEALSAYDTLNNFAREAGLVVEIPHFILVGPTGGKSTLLEAIVGHPVVSMPKKGYVKTQRPLVFTINYNDACDTPKITIMRDTIPDSKYHQRCRQC